MIVMNWIFLNRIITNHANDRWGSDDQAAPEGQGMLDL
jgi:hypothetical protein